MLPLYPFLYPRLFCSSLVFCMSKYPKPSIKYSTGAPLTPKSKHLEYKLYFMFANLIINRIA